MTDNVNLVFDVLGWGALAAGVLLIGVLGWRYWRESRRRRWYYRHKRNKQSDTVRK